MTNQPLISIYLPTHNRSKKLARAIESVINQTYQNYELIICDDGSLDETKTISDEYVKKNKKIRYLRNPNPLGACSARNLGIFSARGEFITGLDDDDEFTQDRLEELHNCWNDNYSFICSNIINIYKNKNPSIEYKKNKTEFTLKDLLLRNEASNQIFTKTERLKSVGGFTPNVKRLQDWDTWTKICAKYGSFYRINKPLYLMHHDHEKNEPRVSNSIPFKIAREELIIRNLNLYPSSIKEQAQREVRALRSIFSIRDMFHEVIYKKSAMPIVRYIKQEIRKIFFGKYLMK